MKEVVGDIWKVEGDWRVIPTNGFVKTNGECVMGRGLALQAKQHYPGLPLKIGTLIKRLGNHVFIVYTNILSGEGFETGGLITFPVKHNWWEKADLELIDMMCQELAVVEGSMLPSGSITLIPRVGCGNGGLDWKDVKPILELNLSGGNFIIVSTPKEA